MQTGFPRVVSRLHPRRSVLPGGNGEEVLGVGGARVHGQRLGGQEQLTGRHGDVLQITDDLDLIVATLQNPKDRGTPVFSLGSVHSDESPSLRTNVSNIPSPLLCNRSFFHCIVCKKTRVMKLISIHGLRVNEE